MCDKCLEPFVGKGLLGFDALKEDLKMAYVLQLPDLIKHTKGAKEATSVLSAIMLDLMTNSKQLVDSLRALLDETAKSDDDLPRIIEAGLAKVQEALSAAGIDLQVLKINKNAKPEKPAEPPTPDAQTWTVRGPERPQ